MSHEIGPWSVISLLQEIHSDGAGHYKVLKSEGYLNPSFPGVKNGG